VEIVAEAGSEAVVVQDHLSLGDHASFADSVVRIDVEANARLDHVVIQREGAASFHIAHTRVKQHRDSRFHSHVLTLSGRLVRNALEVELAEPGAEARLDGAFLGGAEQHVENQTLVVHDAPHCESHELYKGVLGGHSRGVFRGRVDVRPQAQKTNATQSNPNLLVTDHAEIDTKPQLEIRADDVKCSHGSTVGRLDADALFFLRARGLSLDAARGLLIAGFAAEVTERLPGDALASWATTLLADRLHAEDGALAGTAAEPAVEAIERDDR
jgi:Fe-S cluster assembly protein SufD